MKSVPIAPEGAQKFTATKVLNEAPVADNHFESAFLVPEAIEAMGEIPEGVVLSMDNTELLVEHIATIAREIVEGINPSQQACKAALENAHFGVAMKNQMLPGLVMYLKKI